MEVHGHFKIGFQLAVRLEVRHLWLALAQQRQLAWHRRLVRLTEACEDKHLLAKALHQIQQLHGQVQLAQHVPKLRAQLARQACALCGLSMRRAGARWAEWARIESMADRFMLTETKAVDCPHASPFPYSPRSAPSAQWRFLHSPQ